MKAKPERDDELVRLVVLLRLLFLLWCGCWDEGMMSWCGWWCCCHCSSSSSGVAAAAFPPGGAAAAAGMEEMVRSLAALVRLLVLLLLLFSWCGCWTEGNGELTMALRLLAGPSVISSVYLLSFCASLLCSSSSIWSLVFFPVLPVLALLRRKWLLLLWSSGKAGLKRSCWIVGENLVVLGESRRCLTVVRKVAVCFQTVEGESRERGYSPSLPLCFPPLTAIFFRSKLSPSFSFPALSPVFKNSSPPLVN